MLYSGEHILSFKLCLLFYAGDLLVFSSNLRQIELLYKRISKFSSFPNLVHDFLKTFWWCIELTFFVQPYVYYKHINATTLHMVLVCIAFETEFLKQLQKMYKRIQAT